MSGLLNTSDARFKRMSENERKEIARLLYTVSRVLDLDSIYMLGVRGDEVVTGCYGTLQFRRALPQLLREAVQHAEQEV